MFLILRLSFISFILFSPLFSITVLVTKEAIKLEEKISISKLEEQDANSVARNCKPLKKDDILNNEYIANHHINRGTILCEKSVKLFDDHTIVFNFGGLKVVKKGKIIYENDEFIRFKNLDGDVEKIYKDGRIR
ncbi:hypothetical protein [Aliarcobacter thereius]|uniref:hypothetical protein n=1 Tax=Aliarcobacter thereius TaxID=544718 RepID=UPI0010241832|nr:hypothetical protein [Aliarcobacter thereius]QBF15454.1 putative flagellar P ring chaperone FlgA [Aliarcobacter thereius LMG 24486]